MSINFRTLTGEPVRKRMVIPVLIWAFVYVICIFAVKRLTPGTPVSIIIALLPPVVFVWVVISFIKNVSLMDELKRRIYLEASAIAFSLCLILIMILGMLSMVITLNAEDWDYRHLMPFMFIFYFAGLAITKKKYL